MKKFMLFLVLLVYAIGVNFCGSWLLSGHFRLTDIRNPGDVVLLVVETIILLIFCKGSWANHEIPFSRTITVVFGIAGLMVSNYLAIVFVDGGFSTSMALEWYYFRLYLLMILPVAFFGHHTGTVWVGNLGCPSKV